MFPRLALRATAVALGILAVSGAFVVPAHAFTVEKSSSHVIITRSGDDTNTATVTERYGFNKTQPAEAVWSGNYDLVRPSQSIPNTVYSFEFPLSATEGFHLLEIQQTGQATEKFVVYRESLRVQVTNSPVVTVSAMPPVALESSVSVDGTLPVQVASVGDLDSSALKALALMGLLSAGVLIAVNLTGRWV